MKPIQLIIKCKVVVVTSGLEKISIHLHKIFFYHTSSCSKEITAELMLIILEIYFCSYNVTNILYYYITQPNKSQRWKHNKKQQHITVQNRFSLNKTKSDSKIIHIGVRWCEVRPSELGAHEGAKQMVMCSHSITFVIQWKGMDDAVLAAICGEGRFSCGSFA